MHTDSHPTPAPLWRRMAAMVYDLLVTMAVAMAYGALFIGVKYRLLDIPLATGERAHMGLAGFVGLLATLTLFYAYFWHRNGQSLGMRAWRLQIQTLSGGAPSLLQGCMRALLAPLSLTLFCLGYLWCLVSKDRQTLHDQLTKTQTVLLPKSR